MERVIEAVAFGCFDPYNAEQVAACYIVTVLAAGAIAAAVAGLAYIFGLFGKEPTS